MYLYNCKKNWSEMVTITWVNGTVLYYYFQIESNDRSIQNRQI